MIRFPYGIADFRRIRREGMVYVDRTGLIPEIEDLGSVLVFLRPRRFGKSLWLQTLASYYDLRLADEFDELFGGLDIGRRPTPRANRYFIMQWNFSQVSSRGDVDAIAESLAAHVRSRVEVFQREYKDILPEPIKGTGPTATILDQLTSIVSETPYKLYLLIDEYDNFVNEVMARDVKTYKALFENDGPFKELFKSVKSGTEGKGIERVFVTGVAPVALNDLTSGFNNAEHVSQEGVLAPLCGFGENELRGLLRRIAEERGLTAEDVETALDTMGAWYNGYRFSEDVEELVYNPTNVLYFLKHYYRHGQPPMQLHDPNLRSDQGKLAFIAKTAAGAGVIEELTEGRSGTVRISRLITSFSLKELTRRVAKDRNVVTSLLYYMGILTLTDAPLRLRIPNTVVRKLLLDHLLEIFVPDEETSSRAHDIAAGVFEDGEIEPLLEFFEDKILPLFSNRDQGVAPKKSPLDPKERSGSGVNETTVKSLFLSMLFNDRIYKISSEPELERGYADLVLLVRDEMRRHGYFDLLFEFKLVRRNELKLKGRELRDMDEKDVRELPLIEKAFAEAKTQLQNYRAVLAKNEGEVLKLRSYVVVAVGLERMLAEEIV